MVEKIKKLIQEVKSKKGEIILFMLWKDISETEKWTVIVSAHWIEEMGQRAALNYWINLFIKALSKTELDTISRVSFLKPHDKFVEALTSALNISGSVVRFSKNQIGEYFINDAIIFEAKRTPQKVKDSTLQRNPSFNPTINPNLNPTINPNLNPTINPNLNPTINPNLNPTINPSNYQPKP